MVKVNQPDKLVPAVPLEWQECPACGRIVFRLSAISKEDNKTKVCDKCRIEEELILDFIRKIKYRWNETKKWVKHAVRY